MDIIILTTKDIENKPPPINGVKRGERKAGLNLPFLI